MLRSTAVTSNSCARRSARKNATVVSAQGMLGGCSPFVRVLRMIKQQMHVYSPRVGERTYIRVTMSTVSECNALSNGRWGFASWAGFHIHELATRMSLHQLQQKREPCTAWTLCHSIAKKRTQVQCMKHVSLLHRFSCKKTPFSRLEGRGLFSRC